MGLVLRRALLGCLTIACALLFFKSLDALAQKSFTSEQPGRDCIPAAPGPGYSTGGDLYVITPSTFDISTNVEGRVRTTYGDHAQLADWKLLKSLLPSWNELQRFIVLVGIPRQMDNGPCDNVLVSVGGQLRADNHNWLFLARHDGTIPNNWAVLDSIGNHTLDLGRWFWSSQALVVVHGGAVSGNSAPPIRSEHNPGFQVQDNTSRNRDPDSQTAERNTQVAEQRQQTAIENAKDALEVAPREIEEEHQREVGSIAILVGAIVLLCGYGYFIFRRSGRDKLSVKADCNVALLVDEGSNAAINNELPKSVESENLATGNRIGPDQNTEDRTSASLKMIDIRVVSVALGLMAVVVVAFLVFSRSGGPTLEVTVGQLCGDASNPDCGLGGVVRILNRGSGAVTIGRVTVNDKPECSFNVRQTLGIGNEATITAFAISALQESAAQTMRNFAQLMGKNVGSIPTPVNCGQVVKMRIETDRGTGSYTFDR